MKIPEIKFYNLKMSVRHNSIWQAIAYRDIMYLRASGNHTEITLQQVNKQYYVFHSLKLLEKELPPLFFRCHRSTIVNMRYIKKIDKGRICLVDGTDLSVSHRKILLLKDRLARLPSLTVPMCDYCEICPNTDKCLYIRPFITDNQQHKTTPQQN